MKIINHKKILLIISIVILLCLSSCRSMVSQESNIVENTQAKKLAYALRIPNDDFESIKYFFDNNLIRSIINKPWCDNYTIPELTTSIILDSPIALSSVELENKEEEIIEEPKEIIHIVTSKDSLWDLAIKYYDNPYEYELIKEYNNLKSNTIVNGQELKIPIKDLMICEADYSSNSYFVEENNPYIDDMIYIGEYKITGYDPWCAHCCSTTNGITASGVEAEVGRTIAMKGYDFGTEVYIEGYGYYTVEDTGSFKENTIDIACNNHEECYDITNLQGVAVYLVNGGN